MAMLVCNCDYNLASWTYKMHIHILVLNYVHIIMFINIYIRVSSYVNVRIHVRVHVHGSQID